MNTQLEQIKAEIEKQRQLIWPRNTGEMRVVDVPKPFEQGWLNALKWMENLINSLPQEPASKYIVKEGKLTPALASNFCASEYIIDVTLTQEEQEKLNLLPLGSHNVKLEILCE